MSLSIHKTTDDLTLTVRLSGNLDTATSPELEAFFQENLETAEHLLIDCQELAYISSAGLRVILKAYKAMSKKGGMVLTHVNETVMEIFDITGFTDFLTIR